MKARIFCIALCIITVFLVAFGVRGMYTAVLPAENSIDTVLRLASYAAQEHPTAMAAEYFAALVNQQTYGRIRIQVVNRGELGDEVAAVEQLSFGGIAFAMVDCLSMSEGTVFIDENGVVFPDPQMLDMQRLSVLGTLEPDFRCIASSRGMITSAEDCAGLSIGAYTTPLLADQLNVYGFEVVPYSGRDLLSSVYYGYLDSVELSLMNYATENYAQALPYLTLYEGPQSPDLLLCSQVSMGNLPADDQRIIRECAAKAVQYHRAILREMQMKAAADLTEKGVRFYPEEIGRRPSTEWKTLLSRLTGGGK